MSQGPVIAEVSAGVRDFDAEHLCRVCQSHVVAVEPLEILPETHGAC